MAKPNGGIVGQSIIPGTGQLFGVYSATSAAGLTSAGLYSTGNTATKILAVADLVTTLLVYTDSAFSNIADAVATTANTTGNIRIFGTNFVSGSTVYIAGRASAYTNVVSINEIQARVPSLSAGTYSNIMIMSPAGSGILSNLSITTVNTPTFTTASPISYTTPNGNATAISTSIIAIGADRYRISAGSLPANVTFNTTTGALTGTITANGWAAWNFDVTATNDATQTTSVQNYYLVINSDPVNVSYLVVGGGGLPGQNTATGGGPGFRVYVGGGGGAGGYLAGSFPTNAPTTCIITTGTTGSPGPGYTPRSGGNSSIISPSSGFTPIVAYGGGAGGFGGYDTNPGPTFSGTPGLPGGSGGGGGGPGAIGGLGTPGQGNPGLRGSTSYPTTTSRGGGANPDGTGIPNTITGTNIVYAASSPGVSGVPNAVPGTGNGGGPNLNTTGSPGIVVLSYPSPSQLATGGDITTYTSGSNQFWVHKYPAGGTFTIDAGGSLPVWANANVAFYANYYSTDTISTQLRAYNAVSYAIASGNTLPTGFSLTTGGVLSGTVTSERASFYVNATSSTSAVSSQEFKLLYYYPVPTWVTVATLPSGTGTTSYSLQLSATVPTGLGSVVYSVSAGNTMPIGMDLSSSGLLSGSGFTTGTYSFYLKAAHNIGSDYYSERQFSLNITNSTYDATYVLVGGGGGAAATRFDLGAGGGGGGGVTPGSATLISGETYTITVGAGGSGTNGAVGFPNNPPNSSGGAGVPTTLVGSPASVPVSAAAGGGGAGLITTLSAPFTTSTAQVPLAGGYGGPSGNYPGTGFAGGSGGPGYFQTATIPASITSGAGGGGGGGAGAAGANGAGGAVNTNNGHAGSAGGAGATVTIYGTPRVFGGGGAGGSAFHRTIPSPSSYLVAVQTQGLGGAGGGGNSYGTPPSSATTPIPNSTGGVNLGGGGGAGGTVATTPTLGGGSGGWHGGSGIAILSIPTPNYTGAYTGGNVVVATPPNAPGQTILTFNGSGTYTA